MSWYALQDKDAITGADLTKVADMAEHSGQAITTSRDAEIQSESAIMQTAIPKLYNDNLATGDAWTSFICSLRDCDGTNFSSNVIPPIQGDPEHSDTSVLSRSASTGSDLGYNLSSSPSDVPAFYYGNELSELPTNQYADAESWYSYLASSNFAW